MIEFFYVNVKHSTIGRCNNNQWVIELWKSCMKSNIKKQYWIDWIQLVGVECNECLRMFDYYLSQVSKSMWTC